jgi:hypothetical protein
MGFDVGKHGIEGDTIAMDVRKDRDAHEAPPFCIFMEKNARKSESNAL